VKREMRRKAIQRVRTTFIRQKQLLLTGVLLNALLLLLFGICSRLPALDFTPSPSGLTVIDYSTFIAQVKASNVLMVSLQDQDIEGLLARPLSEGQATPARQTKMTLLQAGAAHSAGSYVLSRDVSGFGLAPSTTSLPLDPARMVFTRLPGRGDAALIPLLVSKHVVIDMQPSAQLPPWFLLLWKPLPFLFLLLILVWLLFPDRRVRSPDADSNHPGINQIRSHAKPERRKSQPPETSLDDTDRSVHEDTSSPARPKLEPPPVTFADVAGIDEVRQEVEELVQFLRAPEHFERLGACIPRGALLVGPPGTGKTLLAKAVAGEAGVPFFSVSASEFVEVYVGVGAKRVRDLFHKARENAPCVIFLDELDAVGRKRTPGLGGNDERDQTLNQLLVELDGFAARQTIVVLAATNRADILDPALLRPGRFDRHISVSLPDRRGRQAILQVHTRRTPLHEEVSLERLAQLTTGMSGADLANLVNEAALCAARRNLEHITSACFEEALARVLLGAQRPIVLSETERRIIAFHEAGHALVAHYLPESDRVTSVTILPRGHSLGVTQLVAEEDRYNHSRERLITLLAVGLGGRAAEELSFGPDRVTTGAENDFQAVTSLARKMVTRWGMSEQVGVLFVEGQARVSAGSMNLRYSDALSARSRTLAVDASGRLLLNGGDLPERQRPFVPVDAASGASRSSMATLIDLEVQRLLSEGYQMAKTVLSEHNDQLNRLAHALMEREQLDRAAFEQLIR